MSAFAKGIWFQIFILACLLLTGCDQATPDLTSEAGTEIAADIPTAPPPVEQEQVVSVDESVIDLESAKFTLRVWVTAEINAQPATNGGDVLAAQLQAFDDNHPDVTLDVQVKSVAAQGGMLSYLRTGRSIAPNAMPDLILLPSNQLKVAHNEGLLYPLDSLVSTNGLYPAARQLGTIDGELFGFPLALDNLQHFVYNGNVITNELPSSWSALIVQERAQALFAGAGSQGATLALQLYHAQGGALTDGEDGFTFQRVPLTAMLVQIRDGVNTGVVQTNSAEISTIDEAWTAFQRGDVNVTMADATHLLTKREEGNTSLFDSIPGHDGRTTAIVEGWLLSIVTPDTTRQSLSAELISWLTSTDNLADWSEAAHLLPTRPSAFSQWSTDPYINYLKSELPLAQAYPKTLDSVAQNALSNAVVSIITSPISPEDAANFVIQTSTP